MNYKMADLWCAPPPPGEDAEGMLTQLEKYGYTAVCWCTEVTGRLDSSHKLPAAPAAGGRGAVTPLRRVNVHVEDEGHVTSIHASREVLQKYDLVGLVPHSEAALERCLRPPAVDHIDLISLPSGQRWPFLLKPPLVRKALDAGLHFELCYSAALRDSLARRYLVSNLQSLLQVMLPKQRRSAKGLLFSSGADARRLLRSPEDVSNLLCLFGCHPLAAHQAVHANPQLALQRAAQRRIPEPLAALPSIFPRDRAPLESVAHGKRKRSEEIVSGA
ncbi:hypothetical protein AB1Y20_016045 [Prymnesium parvum]|uniref:Uncharacterized protein n=1 Tax=Prymnesium parvum TaxID=97485 RepID=A0AB34JZI6_PRYPA